MDYFFFHYPTQVFQHHSLGEKAVLPPPPHESSVSLLSKIKCLGKKRACVLMDPFLESLFSSAGVCVCPSPRGLLALISVAQ